jgi:outer membrane protein OmpA-like peptidoglycan-associated protein
MSPSSRFRATPVIAALLVVAGSAAQLGTAFADDTAPVAPLTAPVISIVAPVLDIQFGESDLRSEARVEQLPRTTTITLDSTVLFGKDSAKINAKAKARLQDVARQLKARGPGAVRVTGYTDDLGSAAHGKTLSLQRANAVAEVLRRDLTGSAYPFTVAGKGEADPAVPNKDEASRRINRRVVVIYHKR